MSFLDVNVINNHNIFTTETNRKPTFTSQCLILNSFTLFELKLNINSTYEKLHVELDSTVNFLTNNGFLVNFLYKLITKIFNGLFSGSNKAKVQSAGRLALTVKILFFWECKFCHKERN